MENPFFEKSRPKKKKKKNIPLVTLIFTFSQGIKMLNIDIISWLVGCFRFEAERSVRIWSSGGCFDICFEPKRMPHGKKTPFMCPHGKNQRQNSKEIPPLKTNMALENPQVPIGNTSSNGGLSIVMLVFWNNKWKTWLTQCNMRTNARCTTEGVQNL